MTTLRQAAQQALECIERLNMRGFILADFEDEVESAIDALKAALAQPEQEVSCRFCHSKKGCWAWQCYSCGEIDDVQQPTPPAAQPEQKPVAYYHPHKGFYWAKPTHISAPTAVDVPALPLYVKWKLAQRPWQGLTDEEVQFYIKKHSKLVNAGYDKVTDTNLVAKTFDSTGFYKEVSTVLKERNT